MDDMAASFLTTFLTYFVGPPVLVGLIGAYLMTASRFRGAVVGGAIGMVLGYAAFQVVVINNLEPPPEVAETQPEDPAMVPISD